MARVGAAVCAVAAAVALAGCGPDSPGAVASASPREASPSASPAAYGPLEVEFDMPRGFAEPRGYYIVKPLHEEKHAQWAVPSGARGYDVIAVVSYVVDGEDLRIGDDPPRRLDRYATAVRARSVSEPARTTVNDHPAWQQRIIQPGPDGVTLRYLSTYVLLGQHLVQVICQWDKHKSTVDAACGAVLRTLRFRAAVEV